jgi:hypothetical protein
MIAIFMVLVVVFKAANIILALFMLSKKRKLENFEMISFEFSIVTLHSSYYSAQFLLATAVLTSRFQALNELLENSLKQRSVGSFRAAKFAKLYNNLCDGIEIINETFTFQFAICYSLGLVSPQTKKTLNFTSNFTGHFHSTRLGFALRRPSRRFFK